MSYIKPTNGTFKPTDNQFVPLTGDILLSSIEEDAVALCTIDPQERSGEKAPTHRLAKKSANGKYIFLGDVWKAKSKKDKSYFYGFLNNEKTGVSVRFNLFENQDGSGTWNFVPSLESGNNATKASS